MNAGQIKNPGTDTRAISRAAIQAKEPTAVAEQAPGLVSVAAFAIAGLLLVYLFGSFMLAAAP